MQEDTNWYKVDNINGLDSPALLVYPERVRANIQTAIAMVGDVQRLRPHIKTHKSPEAVSMMLSEGITKFKCATIAEAEILGIAGANDVLLAYQPTGPKLQRFVSLIKKYPATKYSCLVDNRDSAKEQSDLFERNGLMIPVFIDLNVGMNRTGILPGTEAIELYHYCHSLKGIKPVGLHAYDGQVRDVNYEIRKEECDRLFAPVQSMKDALIREGMEAPVIIAGGSHTFSIHCKRTNVECSPGTFVYWDKGNSDYCPEQAFLPAAVLITRVVSIPNEKMICTDLGHKSVAAENELTRRVFFLNAPDLKAISQSEEHLVLDTGGSQKFHPGDILYGLPVHICPTVALYESVIIVDKGMVTGKWKNQARDRVITV